MLYEYINNDERWNIFLEYKLSSNFNSKFEKKKLSDFILNKKYKLICQKIMDENYSFTIPKKHMISKGKSSKKRVVYSFTEEEMNVLKYISYLLYDYDYLFQNNLFSFRKEKSVKTAINKIKSISNIKNMYAYKVDIKNYFNSINISVLLKNLEQDLEDKKLFEFIKGIISNNEVIYGNNKISEEKGAMAGVPISAFLANYYIKEIDEYFFQKKVIYFRYADDIIFFCDSKKEIHKYSTKLKELLKKYKLEINKEKEFFYYPGDKWEFLGFSFCNGKIDLSDNSLRKIKSKIKRSSKGIRKWMLKKNVDSNKALKVMNKKYNNKFFGTKNSTLSWSCWFFPIITTSESLKKIDKYYQENLRYIVTGKHNKKNYKIVPYSALKKAKYKSLIHEYYLFINMKSNM